MIAKQQLMDQPHAPGHLRHTRDAQVKISVGNLPESVARNVEQECVVFVVNQADAGGDDQ